MSRVLVFQHVAAEPLGTLDALLRKRGHRIRFVNFERQPEAQPEVEPYRGLIVLGGPMNVADQVVRPHLRTELRAIDRMLALNRPVLGICLGAQLLAHALGAVVRPHGQPEIGWYTLEPTADAGRDAVFAAMPAQARVFQWHSQTFSLPPGATHLARTASCELQAFRWGAAAYGFQFHLEMDQPLIERWLANPAYRAELQSARIGRGVAEIRAHTTQYVTEMQKNAHAVFGNFLDLVGRPQRRIVLKSREWV